MTATRKPLFSATEEPMTATSTMPSGAKPEKFCDDIRPEITNSIEGQEVKYLYVDPSAGFTAETPAALQIAEMIVTMIASPRNIVIGSGSLFPARSIASRIRSRRLFFAELFSLIDDPFFPLPY